MALDVEIPGFGHLVLTDLVLDVNGTLAGDGVLLPGVAERLERLGEIMALHVLTADTHGMQMAVDEALGLVAYRLDPAREGGPQKAGYVIQLGREQVVAIGNGANDAGMLTAARLGIAVLGPEGTAVTALMAANLAARSIQDALDLLLYPRRLVATLRR